MGRELIVGGMLVLGVLAGRVTAAEQAPATQESLRETPEQRDARMAWWREARFGLFVHWGPVSLKGTEIGWSRGAERRGNGNGKGEIPVEVYDNLYKQFNPVKFNADEWVGIAKNAGMRYLVFTSKHHDGFINFDSKLTDYKITSPGSPYGKDIVAQLAKACQATGMKFGCYYSPPDWHHPDYRNERHAKYIEYMHGQVRELCTNYGPMSIIWFDGLGGTAADWGAPKLHDMIRELQPGVIINNRAGVPADHDTPEQQIGAFQNERPWETCMTLCTQWSWKPDDKMKSLKECIQTLVRTVGGDGNLLFNVGPMPDGRIEPRQAERLTEMGRWLEANGQSIYNTRGGPFKYSMVGPGNYSSTHRGNLVYLHVLGFEEGSEQVELRAIPAKVRSARLIGGQTLKVAQGKDSIRLQVPPASRDEIDTIIVLELDRPASEIKPVSSGRPSLAAGCNTKASNVYAKSQVFGPDQALDGNEATRWATDGGTHAAWLEIDLRKVQPVGAAYISEACGSRVQKFELLGRAGEGGEWKVLHAGKTLSEQAIIRFAPAEVRFVKLNILEASDGPSLWEVQLFPK